MNKTPAKSIILLNTGLSSKKDDSVQVNVQNVGDFKNYQQYTTKDVWEAKVDTLSKLLPKGGAVFCRDSVNELAAALLSKKGISVAHRVPPSTLDAMSALLDAPVAHTVEDISGVVEPTELEQRTIGDMDYIVVAGEGNVTTLVLRGATRQTLDETERGFDDAIGVVCLAYNSRLIIPGGGSSYIHSALSLRSRAAEIGGRAQMAIEAFADALESIPATIAENAGFDPLDTVLELRSKHSMGFMDFGPDIENGGVCSMVGLNVYEPLALVKQAIQSASEVSISILRIDDIIGKRSEE